MIAALLLAAAAGVPEVVVSFDIVRGGEVGGVRVLHSEGCRYDEGAIEAIRKEAKQMAEESPGVVGRRWLLVVKFVPTDAPDAPPKVAEVTATEAPEPDEPIPPQLMHDPPPRYPKKANGRTGHVELTVHLDAKGMPGKVKVVESTDSIFEGPAKVAVRNWIWQPSRKGAEAFPSEVTVCVFFEPKED